MFIYKNPVILIHGFYSTASDLDELAKYLRNLGWIIYEINLTPNTGELELECLAQQLADFVEKKFVQNQLIDIVAFSMGGIITRYYLQRLGGINYVQRFVTIACPHYGTWTAYLCPRVACLQLRPRSNFLQDLNSDISMLKHISFTSIWAPFDLMVVPANSAKIPIGENVNILVLHHAWVVRNRCIFQAISTALTKPKNTYR
ncbi:MAG: lipase [Nostocaceae cyanobacterium]|nr:lipase [Nostocaceae cyanobacterium]